MKNVFWLSNQTDHLLIMHYDSAGVERIASSVISNANLNRWDGKLELPTWMLALWLGIPEDREINTAMKDNKAISSGLESLQKFDLHIWINGIYWMAKCIFNFQGLQTQQ